jgi:hypothetical protein
MDPATFDELERTLAAKGPAVAIDELIGELRRRKDYGGLFYALLMKKRHELGASPLPTGPAGDLPEALHEPYEDAIREAGRLVGRLYLDEGNVPHAWNYFRMLGEPEPVRAALDQYQPGEGDDCQQVIDIALHQGVHPRKGFDLVLDRFGICSAITTMGGYLNPEVNFPADAKEHCIRRLVRSLYEQLRERLAADVMRREGSAPPTNSVKELMAGRDYLFEDDFYHIDVSHLGAVVQMCIHLTPCEEMQMARELCEYGSRLSARFLSPGEPPFEDQYRDYGVYLATLAGDQVEEGIAHFRAKAETADPENVGSYPAEVLVNLLLKLDRPAEALAAARQFLAGEDDRRLTCPGIPELCQRAKDYRALADVARARGDAVNFMAGKILASPPR